MLLAKDGHLKPDMQQQLQQPWKQWQALQQQQPPAQLALPQGLQQQPYMQWPQQQFQGSPLQLPQIPQLPQLLATTQQLPPTQLQQVYQQAQVQAAAAPVWQPSNMRLAAKQQQQRRTKQQHTRASLMQAAAPQPPADSSAAAGDNYEYDELNSPAAAAPPPAAAGDSSVQDADGVSDVDVDVPDSTVDDGDGGFDDGFGPAEGDEQLQPGAGLPGSGKLGEFKLDPNDPYGLDMDFGKNSKINDPFAPPAPPAPPQPPAPKPPPPEPRKGQLTLDIVPDAFVQAVPPSFVGVSREWTPFVWCVCTHVLSAEHSRTPPPPRHAHKHTRPHTHACMHTPACGLSWMLCSYGWLHLGVQTEMQGCVSVWDKH